MKFLRSVFSFFGSNRSQVSLQVVESDIGSVGLNWHFRVEADLLLEFTVCSCDYLAHFLTGLDPCSFLKSHSPFMQFLSNFFFRMVEKVEQNVSANHNYVF